ncbi:Uma2 family endonuclease [Clostridium thermarum]|uniref:Uma2 family endonuclease n=1 Tax=Clostridium thermarum TaxID=1716543 RepID=UPI001FAA8559|nr:Uma2 family endonuclease [Clostridium thermarum]
MGLAQNNFISYEDYSAMREKTEDLLEYIDGIVYMSPSPSTKHQRVSGRLQLKLEHFSRKVPAKYLALLMI